MEDITLVTDGGTIRLMKHGGLHSALGLVEGILDDSLTPNDDKFKGAVDGIESLLVSLHCAGIITPENKGSVEEALNITYETICREFERED